jgi:VWFA-related protein
MAGFFFRPLLMVCVLLGALALVLRPALAQRPQAAVTINELNDSRYPELTAIVTALDANGVPVPGLTAAAFQAFDGERPLAITKVLTAQDASAKLDVVVAIDVSGSMLGEPLDRAKQAATQFVQSLGPNDEAAILTFSDAVAAVTPFTNDRVVLTNAIAGLQAKGSTTLYQAVQASAFAARAAPGQRRAVVLLSDGRNDTQDAQATAAGSTDAARGAGVPFFTIGFGDAPDTVYLQGLSGATQGQFRPATAASVGAVYGDIAALLRNQYVLAITATDAADGKAAELRLVATIGGTAAATLAQFTRGVAPTPAPTASPAPAPAPTPAETASGGGNTAAFVFLGVLGVLAAGGGGLMLVRVRRQRAVERHQRAVVAPNAAQARALGVPSAPEASAAAQEQQAGTGRLVELGGEGRTFELRAGPVLIGSSRRAAVALPADAEVAPEHARIWLRDGHYVLHHAAGVGRRTLVGGKDAEWVTLEPGDEISVGAHRFRFEDEGQGLVAGR